MKFDGPYPKKPTMMDYHSDGVVELISDKIEQALAPLHIKGIQLPKATFLDPKNGTLYTNYYYLHIHHYLECMDKEHSNFIGDEDLDIVLAIKKLVLDHEILAQIPLQDRLVFRLDEDSAFKLFHKSVVDAIMATEPAGIRFVKVESYNPGTAFD